jgi:hypothetical protein
VLDQAINATPQCNLSPFYKPTKERLIGNFVGSR